MRIRIILKSERHPADHLCVGALTLTNYSFKYNRSFLCFFLKCFSFKNQYLLTPTAQTRERGNTNSLKTMLHRTIPTCSPFWENQRIPPHTCRVSCSRHGTVISIATKRLHMPCQIIAFWAHGVQ